LTAGRSSRVDVDEQTRNMHWSSAGRIFKVAPHLRGRRIDELTVDDVAALIAALADAGYKRETIRKTRTALA
jgi:integrase family protein with SAM-like domain